MIAAAMNFKQKMAVVAMDALLIAELAFGIYLGHRHPESLTEIFLKTYVPAALVTVIGMRWLIRRLRSPEVAGMAE